MDLGKIPNKIVARICDYCKRENLPQPGQVRTTKLVYLIECEYYAWERKRLTDLDWIFWHYGPWSPTLDKMLKSEFNMPEEQEYEAGLFRPVVWQPPEWEQPQLKVGNVTAEGVVQRVLERFAAMPYGRLLDFVYFETAPMTNAVKGQTLDFTGITTPSRFVDPVSLIPKDAFEALQARFRQLKVPETRVTGDEGTIDKELAQLLVLMDGEEEFILPEGEAEMDKEVIRDFRTSLGE